MRSGGCAVQQTLTTEAASVLKHSLTLARRRGHAQVTPLHVAATLLSSRTSLLRRACLKSQPPHHSSSSSSSHPLQCRALELCFNVALNRLPTTPGPLLHGQPSLSNALIAALKRAQAHQRRGCIEQQQQQPLLTIKVELEQLVISILDDPSVSRVMREAGFSSTNVKNFIEDSSPSSVFQCYSSSGGVFSSPCSPSPSDSSLHPHHHIITPNNTNHAFWHTHLFNFSEQNPFGFSPQRKLISTSHFSNLSHDHSSSSKEEDIKLVFDVLLRKRKRNTVVIGDSFALTEGLITELIGRLERRDVPDELKQTHFIKFHFPPVTLRLMKKEDIEMHLNELKRKVDGVVSAGGGAIIYTGDLKWTVNNDQQQQQGSGYNPVNHLVEEIGRLICNTAKVWLVATASYQTYRRCQMKQPPLEIQWGLQPVAVPSGGLGLSLHAAASSVHDSRLGFSQNSSQAREIKSFTCKEEEEDDDEEDKLNCCPECTSSYENEAQLFKSGQYKHLPSWLQSHSNNANQKVELRRKWNRLCQSLHQGRQKNYSYASSYPWWPSQSSVFPDSNSISFVESSGLSPSVAKFRRQQSCIIDFDFGTSGQKVQGGEPRLDSLKSSQGKEVKITLALGNSVFPDENEQNVAQHDNLSKALQETVPWQCESVPLIVDALIESKSNKRVTWLKIQGNDIVGKRRLALSIAESFFGSADLLFHVNMIKRSDFDCELLNEKLKKHEKKLVVLVEYVHLSDANLIKVLNDKIGESSDESGSQIIFILAQANEYDYDYPDNEVINMTMKIEPVSDQKRKLEWDFPNKNNKSPRIKQNEDKKDLSRQSSFNTLDLNMKASESEESDDQMGDLSPISTDSTTTDHDVIKYQFIFNMDSAKSTEMKRAISSKLKGRIEEEEKVRISIEDRVIEEVYKGGSWCLVFEKWVKEVFQTSLLNTVKFGGKEEGGIRVIKVCFGGKFGNRSEGGFKGTCLPKDINME